MPLNGPYLKSKRPQTIEKPQTNTATAKAAIAAQRMIGNYTTNPERPKANDVQLNPPVQPVATSGQMRVATRTGVRVYKIPKQRTKKNMIRVPSPPKTIKMEHCAKSVNTLVNQYNPSRPRGPQKGQLNTSPKEK